MFVHKKYLSIIFLVIFLSNLKAVPENNMCKEIEADNTAIFQAAFIGCYNVMNDLIKQGVNINAVSPAGDTPLNLAISGDYISIVKLLLENNANININDINPTFPNAFRVAVIHGNIEIVKIILNYHPEIKQELNPDDNILVSAVLSNNIDMVNFIIDKKLPFNENIIKAIHFCYSIQMFNYLLSLGYDPYAIDEDGDTIIHTLAFLGSTKVLKYILDNFKFNVNQYNFKGETPLLIAIYYKDINKIELLVKHNADIYSKNLDGKNALDLAKDINDPDILKYLKTISN